MVNIIGVLSFVWMLYKLAFAFDDITQIGMKLLYWTWSAGPNSAGCIVYKLRNILI